MSNDRPTDERPASSAGHESDEAEGRAILPLQYYVEFLNFLREHEDRIEVITYDDLCWGDDFAYASRYAKERSNWEMELRSGKRDASKIFVLLHHDVDSFPGLTTRMLREEQRRGIPSTVMIFAERISRTRLETAGQIAPTDYRVDHQYLRHLEASCFVIGYHSNAYERAGFDRQEAEQIFTEDVTVLRQHYCIRYFSPHGGVRDSAGRSNSCMEPPGSLRTSLRWVHNRYGPFFDGSYSDGGMAFGIRHPEDYDLMRFTRTWRPGGRYRVLVHPQYYDVATQRTPSLTGVPWYERTLNAYPPPRRFTKNAPAELEQTRGEDPWSGVKLRRGGAIRKPTERVWRRFVRQHEPRSFDPKDSPILVVGTAPADVALIVSLLQAHPDVSMSKELHPDLLATNAWGNARNDTLTSNGTQAPTPLKDIWLADWLVAHLRNGHPLSRLVQPAKLHRFFQQCSEDGLSKRCVARLYENHLRRGFGFDEIHGRLRFIGGCCRERMQSLGMQRWGIPCNSQHYAYKAVWPNCRFVQLTDKREPQITVRSGEQATVPGVRTQPLPSAAESKITRFPDCLQDDVFKLSCDKLQASPGIELRALFDYLDLAYSPMILHDLPKPSSVCSICTTK